MENFEVTKFEDIHIVSPFYVMILGNKGGLFKGGYYLKRCKPYTALHCIF
jgi:hypothetical protein